MNTLATLPVTAGHVGGEAVSLVDARRLHGFLEVGRDFSNWIKDRIAEYGFVEGEDYVKGTVGGEAGFSPDAAKNARGRPAVDYGLTLDMAKELAMVERTARGRQARRYFIACERQWRDPRTAAPVTTTRAQRRAINRQAWAEVTRTVDVDFRARRETLMRQIGHDAGQRWPCPA